MGLSSNCIGDVGAKALADMLCVNSALETLYLEENDVAVDGEAAAALRHVLLHTCSVKPMNSDMQLAFMMGTHPRLGNCSLIHDIDEGISHNIVKFTVYVKPRDIQFYPRTAEAQMVMEQAGAGAALPWLGVEWGAHNQEAVPGLPGGIPALPGPPGPAPHAPGQDPFAMHGLPGPAPHVPWEQEEWVGQVTGGVPAVVHGGAGGVAGAVGELMDEDMGEEMEHE